MGAGSEAALVSFPGGWKVLLLWVAGKCARVFVRPLVFGFLLNVCASRSRMIDMDMCLVGGLHCLRLYEVLTEGKLPHSSQKVKDRQEGARVPVLLQGHILSHMFHVTVIESPQKQVQRGEVDLGSWLA